MFWINWINILVELDIPQGKEPIEDMSTTILMNVSIQINSKNKFIDELKMELDVLITLGAGDLDTLIPDLIKILK